MATHRLDVLGTFRAESGVFLDLISNQITAVAAPSVGSVECWVFSDADLGGYGAFAVPKNYVGTPKLVAQWVLDGAPGASDTLAIEFRKRATANNEASDGTFDAAQTTSSTIGSSGSGHSDEDLLEHSITLTAGDYAVDDVVFYRFRRLASGTYAGNSLLVGLFFEYADA